MDLTELRSLVEVVRTGSIAAAARALGYSPSAVSRHISNLERRVGLTLLRRTARSSVPTLAARRIADQARIVLDESEALLADVAAIRDGAEGALRLAYTRAGATVLVPRALALLKETHPGIKVTLQGFDLDDGVIDALRRGTVDLGLVWGFPDREERGLETHPLLSEDLVLVTADSRPELHTQPIDLARLATEPTMSTIGHKGTPPLVDRIFLDAGLQPPPRDYQIADHAQMHGIVRAGPEFTAPSTSPFLDVPTSHVFYDEIAWLADTGITTGWTVTGGAEFRPTWPVKRDQMAAFLYRYAQLD